MNGGVSGSSSMYGAFYPGGSTKFQIRDERDVPRIRISSQAFQSGAYMTLNSPTPVIGLYELSNYLELLTVGTAITDPKDKKNSYTVPNGIIPNSFLILTPPHPGNDDWHVELQINAAKYSKFVWVGVAITMFLLGLIVIILHWLEKREDRLEKKKIRHIINFESF